MSDKVFITGGTGRLGQELVRIAKEQFGEVLAPTRQELNLLNDDAIRRYIRKHQPDYILHSAAMNSSEMCETLMTWAWATNAEATRVIFEEGEKIASRMCLVSTPSVFMGRKAPFKEDSPRLITTDLNNYAISKIGAESYATQHGAVIIRTNFITKGKYPHEQAFTDRIGNWVYPDQAATEIIRILKSSWKGAFHVCGKESLSMFDFAKKTRPDVKPITMANYNGSAPLMIDQRLISTRLPTIDTFKKVRR